MIFCTRPRSTRTERSELSSLRFRIEFRQRLRSRRYYIPWAEDRPVFRDLLLVPSKFRRLQSGWLNSWSNPAALPRLERAVAPWLRPLSLRAFFLRIYVRQSGTRAYVGGELSGRRAFQAHACSAPGSGHSISRPYANYRLAPRADLPISSFLIVAYKHCRKVLSAGELPIRVDRIFGSNEIKS
jgi:hypothetical protein